MMDNEAKIALIMEEYGLMDEEFQAQLAAALLRFFNFKGDVTADDLLRWADHDLEQLYKIMSGMRLTRLYVPDIIDSYAGMESGELPSRVSFGSIPKNEHPLEESRMHRQYGSYEVPPAIHRLYELEAELGDDKNKGLGLTMQKYDSRYPCTPPDFIPFASSGDEGIHYCFVTDFGTVKNLENAYIAIVAPMNIGAEISLIARNLNDFLRLLLTKPAFFQHSLGESLEHRGDLTTALQKLKKTFDLTEMVDLAQYKQDLHEERERAICIQTLDSVGVVPLSGLLKRAASERLPSYEWEDWRGLQANLEIASPEGKLAFVRNAQLHKKLADKRVYRLCKQVLKELELYYELYNLSEIVE